MHAKKQQIAVMLVAAVLGLATAGVRAQETVPPDQGRPRETERDTPPQATESYNRAARSGPADMKQGQQIKVTELRGYGRPSRTFERETAEASLEREPVRAVQGNGARQLITHPDHANLFEEPLFGKALADKSRAPATDTSDETMQQRVSDSLQQISMPGSPQTVSVTVQNGIVTLRGTVANDTEKRNIETTVKQMSGVRRVNNQLTVQSR